MIQSLILRALSAVWSLASAFARRLSQTGIVFKPTKLGPRVISVGNLQVGGAGKTPLVAQIANEAIARGLKTCILCRGYGSRWERRGGVLAPSGEPVAPGICGDEPALLREICPGAWIGVGSDRIAQFRRVVATLHRNPDVVILDDGFQHWRIAKDVEVVAVTSRGPGEILFRDRRVALKHATLVVWTKGEIPPDTKGRPLVRVRLALEPDSSVPPTAVWVVTGVADGRNVVDSAVAAGYRIQRHIAFKDHHAYTAKELDKLLVNAREAGCKIAITGKDWVKWRDLSVAASEVVVLEPKIIFESGRREWEKALWGA